MFKKLILSIIAGLSAFSLATPVLADDLTVTTTETPTIGQNSRLTIKYFDDQDETIPVTGAEFTIYQVASVGTDIENNGAYIPLTDSISFESINEVEGSAALDYEEKVLEAYEENPKLGYTGSVTIGEDGLGVFEDIPVGAYLITETKTMRYHIRSIPFLISTPAMNENNNGWNFDITANPKQILAGDLVFTKQVIGKELSKNRTYTIKLSIPAGTYKMVRDDGTTASVKNGTGVSIKNGETIRIIDLPAGTTYKITEVEANTKDYDTTYVNQSGTIQEKTEVNAKVINDSSRYDTGEGNKMLFELIGGAGALALLIVLVATRKKGKSEKEEGKEGE